MKSSGRAPALRAMAFHPFVTGTVIRTFGRPRAFLTGRITPGMTERMPGLSRSSRSSTGRSPSMMLCSIFSLPCSARNLIQIRLAAGCPSWKTDLFKSLLILNIDPEQAIFITNSNQRIFAIQSPFKAKDLFSSARKVRYVSNGDLSGYRLFEREAGLRHVFHSLKHGIDFQVCHPEEPLQPTRIGRNSGPEEITCSRG